MAIQMLSLPLDSHRSSLTSIILKIVKKIRIYHNDEHAQAFNSLSSVSPHLFMVSSLFLSAEHENRRLNNEINTNLSSVKFHKTKEYCLPSTVWTGGYLSSVSPRAIDKEKEIIRIFFFYLHQSKSFLSMTSEHSVLWLDDLLGCCLHWSKSCWMVSNWRKLAYDTESDSSLIRYFWDDSSNAISMCFTAVSVLK